MLGVRGQSYSPRNVFVLELWASQPKFGTTHLEVCLRPIRVLSDAEIKDTRSHQETDEPQPRSSEDIS